MSPRRHLVVAAVIWAVLSALAMLVVAGIQILPEIAAREAEIEDGAFVLLTVASMPVLMFVVVVAGYSAIRFRAHPADLGDGPHMQAGMGLQAGWLLLTLALVIFLFAYGTIGLLEIRGATNADFEVDVRAEQWAWHFAYPEFGVVSDELHVPLGRRVRFVITSDDAIHSLWVPAFGIKQDAVPGRTTIAYATLTQAGTYGGQCTELCGLGHTGMTFTSVVSEPAELAAWASTQESE